MPVSKIRLSQFSPEVLDIYQMFQNQPDSERIAEPVTLEALYQICKTQKPLQVLELGGGLGTISYLLLSYSNAKLDIYEHSQVFETRLRENLSEFDGRFQIIRDYRILPPRRAYDLVVVDGGQRRKDDSSPAAGFNEAVWLYLNYLKSVKLVYIEGSRNIQRIWTRKALKRRYLYSLARYADVEFRNKVVKGGLLIECQPSRFRLGRLLNFLFWEIVEWQSIRNFILFNLKKLR